MENKSNTLSVVVPVYNEEDNILPLVSAVHNALIDERRQWELLIVDDGSSDDTWERLEQARSEFGDHVRIFELNKNHQIEKYSFAISASPNNKVSTSPFFSFITI